jgi:hypothetical protein
MTSTDDLLDLRNIGQRAETFRFDVLDENLADKFELKPAYDQPPTITNDTTRRIKRDLSGLVLPPGTYDDVDFMRDRVRASLVLENGAVMPLGVFVFVDDPERERSFCSTITASLVDQCTILDQPWPYTFSMQPGLSIAIVLAIIFEVCGFPKGRYVVDQFPNLVRAPIAWPAGTSLLKIMNDLCALVGAYSVFFTNDGIGRVQIAQDLATATPAVRYESGLNIVEGSIVRTSDRLIAPNRYVVVDSGANDAPVMGIYDIPAEAPNSFQNRGRRLVRFISEQGLDSGPAAVARAKAAYDQDTRAAERIECAGIIDPRLDTFSVVEFLGDRWRVEKWGGVQLRPGALMPLSLRKVYAEAA